MPINALNIIFDYRFNNPHKHCVNNGLNGDMSEMKDKHVAIEITQIGVIHSPYKKVEDVPFQAYKSEEHGDIEVFQEYAQGLKDTEGFSHLVILYYFHLSEKTILLAKPFLDDRIRGVFATRSPNRPNHIGVSVVKLLRRYGNMLRVQGLDVVDGTPLIDIKPYVPRFTEKENVKIGWLEGKLKR